MFYLDEILKNIDYIYLNESPDSKFIKNISIDTRTIEPGEAFIALKGENFDGHEFLPLAFKKGSPIAFVEEDWYKNHSFIAHPLVVVKDTKKVLGEIANFHRNKFDLPIIAVAGSNGKTTSKDFIAHLLSQRFRVLKTEENFNNQIGVPLTLLKLNSSHDIAVIEIGTNKPGEVAYLTDIVEPNFGLITNIGKEHLEFFEDLDGVEQEETTLFGYLLRKNGLIFLNIDDERLAKYSPILGKFITYGTTEGAYLHADISYDDILVPKITYRTENKSFTVKLRVQGISPALCSIPAVTISLYFELSEQEILHGLESFEIDSSKSYGRMLIKNVNGVTIINDTYNANPSSMELALKTIEMLNSEGNKIGILGDMKELGDSSLDEHREIILKASKVFYKLGIFGHEMKSTFDALSDPPKNIYYFDNKEDILSFLKHYIYPKDIVLFKASREIQLEELVQSFIKYLT
ncbi:MAG: UDP-N-acetylmuramoyl-tripeptide--D-alanyl-D-alanine ligase [Candidatus Kapaibacteriales bacterium]